MILERLPSYRFMVFYKYKLLMYQDLSSVMNFHWQVKWRVKWPIQ